MSCSKRLGLYFLLFLIVPIQFLWAVALPKTDEKANLTINIGKTAVKCSHSFQNCIVHVSQNLPQCLTTPGSIVITNNSRISANNIQASSSNSFFTHYVLQNNGCPTSLAPGNSCSISFFTNTSIAFLAPDITVKGTNTNSTFFDIQAFECSAPQAILSAATPTNINLTAGGSSQSVTVVNIGNANANNVQAVVAPSPALGITVSSNCPTVLVPNGSCQLTFTSGVSTGITTATAFGSNTVNSILIGIRVNAAPEAILSAATSTTLNLTAGGISQSVTIVNIGTIPAANVQAAIAPVPPLGINVSSNCPASLIPNDSCQVFFQPGNTAGNTVATIFGTNTSNSIPIGINVSPPPPAIINVNPTILTFTENSTGDVTVTNNVGSPSAAENVVATIPGGSNIIVQSTTCGASLGIGASCTITFTSSVAEGPTTIPIAGGNTNTVNVDVTVNSQPQISITNPVQQNRIVTVSSVVPLSLEVTNNVGSVVNADAITVSNDAGCPNLVVDDSNCTSVAPGASCTLELTSPTPYAPCTITVSGSNTANSPQALIAFAHLGGLVFEESGGVGKVVIDVAQEFTSQWTSAFTDIAGATSLTDGLSNTNAIVLDPACIGDTPNCAAQRCRNIDPVWFLPARDELFAIQNSLCANDTIPCNFGGFSSALYWSSSQDIFLTSWFVDFPAATTSNTASKTSNFLVRCIQNFP